jgi:hypothetical protein
MIYASRLYRTERERNRVAMAIITRLLQRGWINKTAGARDALQRNSELRIVMPQPMAVLFTQQSP